MLIGDKLSQRYDNVTIIRDVTLSVAPGSVTVLIGKSGCGKSTLLRTLSLIDPPSEGVVSLNGQRIFPSSSGTSEQIHIWPRVTLLFQQFFLWPHIDVRRNIVLPAILRKKSIDRSETLCRALGIDGLLARYPSQISVGQRQRAALARALLLEPDFLLLDEITSAQDVEHISLILDVLEATIASGMGLLVVSHHFGFVRRLLSSSASSQIVFLDEGMVVESGGIEHLESPVSEGLRQYCQLSQKLG